MARILRASAMLALGVAASCGAKAPAAPDASSNGAEAAGPPVFVWPEPARVVVEAESGNVEAPYAIEAAPGTSGGKCVVLAEKWETDEELHPSYKTKATGELVSAKEDLGGNPRGVALVPNGMVELRFEIAKAGRYAFWARANFHCACADSLYFGVDSDIPVDTDGNGEYDRNPPATLGGSTHRRWKWFEYRGARFDLDARAHVLRIFPREDGIRIDQVLFAEVPEPPVEPYVPQGIERSSE